MALTHSLSAPSSDLTPTSSSSAMDELIVARFAASTLTTPWPPWSSPARPRLLLRRRPHRRRGRLQGRHQGPRRRPRRRHGRVPQAHRRAIAGFTVTAGFEIALACDLLVAGRDTKFADPTLPRPPLLADLSYPCAAAPRQLQLPEAVAPRQPLRRRGRRFSPTPTTRGRVAPRRPLRPRPPASLPTLAPLRPSLRGHPLRGRPLLADLNYPSRRSSPTPVPPRPPASSPTRRPRCRMKEYLMHLVYVEMLGHNVSFGHIHAVKMTHDESLAVKRTNYLVVTLFLQRPSLAVGAFFLILLLSCFTPSAHQVFDLNDTAWIDAEFKAGAEQKEATENTLAAYKADQDMVLTELTPTRHARQLFDEMPRIWL
uniref:Uncharacterized protein n=1 Tax=Ananas comosus var. bracteatus TaxID=296719 RepID=A0A6V7QLQ4_ANACO|nr:unnamed protein product [Ananas comosus var. bracteatus]